MKRFLYRAHRGTSLVEILVAMVILLVGIYSLVRLFPAGFTNILYGRNVTAAQALTNGMIQQARVRYDNLPKSILAFNPLTSTVFPSLPVDEELTPYQPNGFQAPEARFSDLNKVRRVIGEATKIPAPTIDSPYSPGAPISVYFLNFAPIYSATATFLGRKPTGLGGVHVYSGNALKRVVFNGPPSDEDLAALDLSSYGIDYNTATLYFKPVDYERRFKIDYSFTVLEGSDGLVHEQSRPDSIVQLAPNTGEYDLRQAHAGQPIDAPFFPLPAGARLEPGEESLYRAFELLAATDPFSNTDPYQFKVLNAVAGILGFNPLGAVIRTSDNPGGIVANIDYDVDDWHIIHDDRTVPNSPPFTVKLTLNGIAHLGDVDDYQETYNSLIKGYPDRPAPPNSDIDVLIVDLETGRTIDSRTLQNSDDPNAHGSELYGRINYPNGSITFHEQGVQWALPNATALSPVESIAGKRVRIFYRTQQNWAVQLTKAFPNYVREPNAANLGYQEFAIGTKGYLFFPVQDHGQSVLIDYTWVQNVDGQQVLRTETGEYHRIANPTDSDSPQNLYGSPFNYWWVQPDAVQRAGYVDGSLRVMRVRGVTVRSRAIWREGDRWRQLDIDSYIGRDRGT